MVAFLRNPCLGGKSVGKGIRVEWGEREREMRYEPGDCKLSQDGGWLQGDNRSCLQQHEEVTWALQTPWVGNGTIPRRGVLMEGFPGTQSKGKKKRSQTWRRFCEMDKGESRKCHVRTKCRTKLMEHCGIVLCHYYYLFLSFPPHVPPNGWTDVNVLFWKSSSDLHTPRKP